jgi:hypothetical protein
MTLLARLTTRMTRLGARPEPLFGASCFAVHGNVAIGAGPHGLVVRVGADAEPGALTRPGATRMLVKGKPMAGWVLVSEAACSDADLDDWLDSALEYNRLLPPDAARPKSKRRG